MRVSFVIVALLTSHATAFPAFHGAGNATDDSAEFTSFSAAAVLNMADHPFLAPTETDSRSPCPCLNSLANHGFIPHDGKAITADNLKQNLMSVYGLTFALATGLIESGWQACGKFTAGKKAPTDLREFAKHNKIEHDVSLAHADAAPGEEYAPVTTDQGILQDLISRSADGQILTLEEVSQFRVAHEDVAPVPLSVVQQLTGQAEGCLMLQRFGDTDTVPVADVQTFLGESRIPDSYTGPKGAAGFVNIGLCAAKMARTMGDIRSSS